MLATVKLFFLKCNLSPPPSKLVEDKLVLILLIYYYTSMSHFNLLLSSLWFSARLACLQRWKKSAQERQTVRLLCLSVSFFNLQSSGFLFLLFLSLCRPPPILEQFTVQHMNLGISPSWDYILQLWEDAAAQKRFMWVFYFLSSTNKQ